MKKNVPILILDNTFSFGGAIKSLYYLLCALDRSQFKPILVTGQTTEFLSEYFDCTWYHFVPKLPWVNNLIYRKISAWWVFRFKWLRRTLNILRYLYWIVFVTFPEALRYFQLGRKNRVALVHLNNILGSQFAGILAAKLLRVPCVAHLRDFEAIHPITRFYAHLIDHHIAISNAIRDNLLQLGVADEKITVVHDAIDLAEFQSAACNCELAEEFGLAPEQPTFGIFGRVVEWKGIREFIHAVRDVVDDIPEARAFVVGGHSDGDEVFFHSIQQLVTDLGLARNVVFTGYRKDVPALMGLMDVVVHASLRPEPFGMVLIEGMAMRKPIVATRGGGPLDIVIDGETGLLVEMRDPKALGCAITTLLRDPGLRRKMGVAGLEQVSRKFTSPRYAHQVAAIYQHLGAAV